ncbi:NADP-dependent 3-hydroxy acid dehydrogenase YdfG [Pseudarthrobacter oxydans]|uniref:NADP-dependent 3-hydroxy acid dehydrogenase YdfG n=1 Tax=Pseudarthrobacter oxydans TaxID=1671 RepID=A0AAW8NII5_PSEOX|nr:SDR family NAD(P)-dependent oxidoreductase [Pseudarthrobacter oxydans]MDR7165738.1 NADP-dependent 3-hydroxy acid dehydrogenase YdfG [Pseudarthrobacter oxydans]
MPTIAIIGAGPGLGRSLAFTFGREGFDVALVARNPDKLSDLVGELGAAGISAAAFPADVRDTHALSAALAAAGAEFGGIDVLEFSPYSGLQQIHPDQVTVENLIPELETNLIGGIAAVQAVLPGMVERGSGTILFTTGGGAINPYPMLAATNAAQAGLRNFAHNLHNVIADKGVHVATVAINVFIGAVAPEGVPHRDPDDIAQVYWNLHRNRDRVEELVTSHPDGQ